MPIIINIAGQIRSVVLVFLNTFGPAMTLLLASPLLCRWPDHKLPDRVVGFRTILLLVTPTLPQ